MEKRVSEEEREKVKRNENAIDRSIGVSSPAGGAEREKKKKVQDRGFKYGEKSGRCETKC